VNEKKGRKNESQTLYLLHDPPNATPIQYKRPPGKSVASKVITSPGNIPSNVNIIISWLYLEPVLSSTRGERQAKILHHTRRAGTARSSDKGALMLICERLMIPGIPRVGAPAGRVELHSATAAGKVGIGESNGALFVRREFETEECLDVVHSIAAEDLGWGEGDVLIVFPDRDAVGREDLTASEGGLVWEYQTSGQRGEG